MPRSAEPGIHLSNVNGRSEHTVSDRSSLLAGNQPRVEIRDEVVGDGVGNDVDSLEYGEAVAHLTHDYRDRCFECIRNRSENLGAGLFLAPLHLAEVAESNACLARDLTKSTTLLQAEVPEHVTDFLTK